MAWFGQWAGTTTGQWWGDSGAAPPVGDESGWRGAAGNDEWLHRAPIRHEPIPAAVARAIERTAKDAAPREARAVLEAQIDRAGEEWDERFYDLLHEMQRRDIATLRELLALQARQHEMEMADDEDAIAVVMMLH